MVDDTYRILGEIDSPDSVGIRGENLAETGAGVGVEGRTSSPEGYGLATPDDAKVGGRLTAGAVDAARVDSVQFASAHDGETGAAKINSALDALPARGGTVFVGSNGPDTVDGEASVWEVDRVIQVDSGQWLVGAGPGWHEDQTGTALRASAQNGEMVQFSGTYLTGLTDMRLDGNGTETVCARLGDGRQNDFVLRNAMVHGATNHGVTLEGQRNFWLDQCWIEQCGTGFENAGIATLGGEIEDTIWITDCLFFDNYHDILFDHAATQTVTQVWISNLRTDGPHHHAIVQRPDAAIRDVWVVRPHIDGAGKETDSAWDAMNFTGSVERLEVQSPVVLGRTRTRHALYREQGQWTDCVVENLQATGLTDAPMAGVVGSANSTRSLVNGWGTNAGDPATTGDWNGAGREGVNVFDTTNEVKYAYVAGAGR